MEFILPVVTREWWTKAAEASSRHPRKHLYPVTKTFSRRKSVGKAAESGWAETCLFGPVILH